MNTLLYPEWETPENIFAYTTMRYPGKSLPPYDGFNLAYHVGDNAEHVDFNQKNLTEQLHLPSKPFWLNQIHSNIALNADQPRGKNQTYTGDASFTQNPGVVCAIMTADCLPILLCSLKGDEVAAIHAGWRGLASGIIENTLKHLKNSPVDLTAWIGPAISQPCFEVGRDVLDAFRQYHSAEELEAAFIPSTQYSNKWLADLSLLAKQRLNHCGVYQVTLSGECTYSNPDKYFSYRRDKGQTGRIASLIWMGHTQNL